MLYALGNKIKSFWNEFIDNLFEIIIPITSFGLILLNSLLEYGTLGSIPPDKVVNLSFSSIILVSSITLIYKKILKNRKNKGLQDVFTDHYSKKTMDDVLYKIFTELNLTSDERISIYQHETDSFIIRGRYSEDPELNKIRRKLYKSKDGFISNGWRRGYYLSNNLQTSYDTDKKKYIQETLDECKINAVELKNIRMKSLVYSVHRVDKNSSKLAVIVFESLRSGMFQNRTDIDKAISKHKKAIISNLEELRDCLSNAKLSGF